MPYFIKNNLQLAAKTKKGNLSEVNLFREMMGVFRRYYHATVILNETHQKLVDFDTHNPYTNTIIPKKTKEISDLHIITYSPSRCIARETFLQAKVARGNNGLQKSGTFRFEGDWFQYDLLSRRPLIYPPHRGAAFVGSYCHGLLQNAVLPSIGSYGIFYKDNSNLVNFAYQPADLLQLIRMQSNFKADFHMNSSIPSLGHPKGVPDLSYTTNVDIFEDAVIHNLVGSPFVLQAPYYHYYYPYWWHWYDDLYYKLATNKNNSKHQIEEVLRGLEDFGRFIYQNREIFIRDGEEQSDTLNRYHELGELGQYDRESNNFSKNIEEYTNRNSENENSGICRGPISLILLNTDNCK